jgi:hypothetical protein
MFKCWILLKPVLEGVDGILHFPLPAMNRAGNIFNFVVLDILKGFHFSLFQYPGQYSWYYHQIFIKNWRLIVWFDCFKLIDLSHILRWEGNILFSFFVCLGFTAQFRTYVSEKGKIFWLTSVVTDLTKPPQWLQTWQNHLSGYRLDKTTSVVTDLTKPPQWLQTWQNHQILNHTLLKAQTGTSVALSTFHKLCE